VTNVIVTHVQLCMHPAKAVKRNTMPLMNSQVQTINERSDIHPRTEVVPAKATKRRQISK